MIIRVEKNKDNPYVVINKTLLEDKRLSWKAKGMLTYLLSKPDNWKPIREELVKASKDGITVVRNTLKELEELGYMKRQPIREDGKIKAWEHVVYEIPQTHQISENLLVENLPVEKSPVDNLTLISNDLINNDLINNKKDIICTLFDYWNSKGIIVHRKLTDTQRRHINAKLKDYTADEIREAIDNYATILNNDEYTLTHRWKLEEFLTRGFEKLKTESNPFESYRRFGTTYKPKQNVSSKLKEIDSL